MNALRKIVQYLLHPFPVANLLLGQNFSRYDFLSERLSLEMTEKFFQENKRARSIAAMFSAFFDDVEATRALKKHLHGCYELRMRCVATLTDKPEDYGIGYPAANATGHPLDQECFEDLKSSFPDVQFQRPRSSHSGYSRYAVSTILWALALVHKSIWLYLRWGQNDIQTVNSTLISPPFWPSERWRAMEKSFTKFTPENETTLVFAMEREPDAGFRRGNFPAVDIQTAPVPRREWWTNVVVPAAKLAIGVCRTLLSSGRTWKEIEVGRSCVHLAYHSLDVWRTGFNLRFKYCVDIYEYNPLHIIRGIVFRKFGGGVARLPHSQMDTPGSALSYLAYDLFLSPGPYQTQSYSSTWRPGLRTVTTGQMLLDHRLASKVDINDPTVREISTCLDEGQSLAVFFGPSPGFGMFDVAGQFLGQLWPYLQERPEWTLVIKPKGSNAVFDFLENRPEFNELLDHPRVIKVSYASIGEEVCPSGWLIGRAEIGLSLPGSVQVEGLTQGRPFLSYYPIVRDTTLWNKLQASGLLADNMTNLQSMLDDFFTNPSAFEAPFDWFRENFDPYCDDQALERIAAALLTSPTKTPSTEVQ